MVAPSVGIIVPPIWVGIVYIQPYPPVVLEKGGKVRETELRGCAEKYSLTQFVQTPYIQMTLIYSIKKRKERHSRISVLRQRLCTKKDAPEEVRGGTES